MSVALVCIAKNEDLYLHEWVAYHLKLGFDRIFIYQNNWRTPLTHPQVTKFEFDHNKRQQLHAYKNFTLHQWPGYDWAMFMDVDEFLVLKQHKTVGEFCKAMSVYPAVGIPWVFFGDSGQPMPFDDYSVLKRFTWCSSTPDWMVKSLVRLHPGIDMHIHRPRNTKLYTPSGKILPNKATFKNSTSIAQINHYFCKTFPEFECKVRRGRAYSKGLGELSAFDAHNFNDIEDTTARDFLYGNSSGVYSEE